MSEALPAKKTLLADETPDRANRVGSADGSSARRSTRRGQGRDDRIEIRCFADEKELLRRAARHDNRTLSNWLLHVALREARRTVDAATADATTEAGPDGASGSGAPHPDSDA